MSSALVTTSPGGLQERAEEQRAPLSDGNQFPVTEERSVVGSEQKRTEGDAVPRHRATIAASELFGIFSGWLQYREPVATNSPQLLDHELQRFGVRRYEMDTRSFASNLLALDKNEADRRRIWTETEEDTYYRNTPVERRRMPRIAPDHRSALPGLLFRWACGSSRRAAASNPLAPRHRRSAAARSWGKSSRPPDAGRRRAGGCG